MDLHKISFVGMLTIQDYLGDWDLLLITEEPVALNNENDTAEENQPLTAYRKQSEKPLNVFYNMKLCSVWVLCPTAYRASFKI